MDEIKLFAVHMPTAVDKPLLEIIHSGYIGQGKKVDEYEEALAEYLENENILTLNSGTSAIELALHLAGVKKGTSVVTTPMTCSATNTSIVSRGADIIWADIDPDTGLLDIQDAIRKLRDDTVAVIGVDWGGQCLDWHALMAAAALYGFRVIEDAAHALGGRYGHGRGKVGNGLVDMTVFSTQAIKTVTTVDGGILALKRSSDYKRGKLLRWYGIDRETDRKDMRCEEDIEEAGWKWHMNDVNATIGLIQLQYLDGLVALQRANAKFYHNNLKGIAWPFPIESLYDSSYWLFTLLCRDKEQRLRFMEFMKSNGIMVSQVHSRNDTHTCFNAFRKNPLPGVDSFTDRQVNIPVHWKLTEAERDKVANKVNEFFAEEALASISV